ncbi:MAG: hypothetical protein H0U72_09905 [Nitrosospira sp.]|nr:hypothetical protein [Nitrosospira sp.]
MSELGQEYILQQLAYLRIQSEDSPGELMTRIVLPGLMRWLSRWNMRAFSIPLAVEYIEVFYNRIRRYAKIGN